MIAIDTETFPIVPGCLAPQVVCISYAHTEGTGATGYGLDHAVDASAAFTAFADICLGTGRPLIGANIAYDLAVLWAHDPDLGDRIWRLYDAGLVRDVLIRQKMLDIAQGCYRGFSHDTTGKAIKLNYGLGDLVQRHIGHEMPDEWRLKYHTLYEVPIREWPADAIQYAVDDAIGTLGVYQIQEADAALLADEPARVRTAWMLHLMSCHGIHTDPEVVRVFTDATEHKLGEMQAYLESYGLVRSNGKRDTKAAKLFMANVCSGQNRPIVATDGGDVALDDATCKATQDPVLIAYAEFSSLKKVVSTDIPILAQGLIQTRFEPLVETGRTGSSAPNIQNIKRVGGMRECFRPRWGYVYVDADYSVGELCTWAQVCLWLFGRSRLAEVLNAGADPHLDFAAQILGITYDEAKARRKAGDKEVEQNRLVAKVGNFGFPGGLGVTSFVQYAASSYKVTLTEDQARDLKRFWLASWPEAGPYFDYISSKAQGPDQRVTLQRPVTGSWRSNMKFTEACNDNFQSLLATAATWAGYDLARCCYHDTTSILYGSRPVNFIHDQYLVEVLDDHEAHDKAQEVARLMVAAAKRAIPDVTPRVEFLLSRMWSKDAKATYDAQGRLVPWNV